MKLIFKTVSTNMYTVRIGNWMEAVEYFNKHNIHKMDTKDIHPVIGQLPLCLLEEVSCDTIRKIWELLPTTKQRQLVQRLPKWKHHKTNKSENRDPGPCADCRYFFTVSQATASCQKHYDCNFKILWPKT